MIKKNYAAWQIDPNEFSHAWNEIDKLKFFARYALLAPSGHNTQPWQLTVKDKSIDVSINKSHYLSIDGSGLLSVEPYISIGTFLEVFSLAAHGFGYELNIKLLPKEKVVAEVSLKSRIKSKPILLAAITNRASNRNPFEQDPIDNKTLKEIMDCNFPGVKTTVLTDRPSIDFVAEQTEAAVKAIMGNQAYRDELSAWVRTNQTRKYEGMPGFTHGFGTLKSLLSKPAIRRGAKLGPQARKSAKLINDSGALIIVRCIDNRKESFINAGRIYSRICVLANSYQLDSSALGASVLDPDTRKEIKGYFNINDRPVYILRLGRAKTKAKHSPRWPLELIISQSTS